MKQGRQRVAILLLLAVAGVGVGGCPGSDNPILKKNQPPRISRVEIRPAAPGPGQNVSASVQYHDPDRDEVFLEFRWFVDGALVQEGSSNALDGTKIGGAEIKVEVRARDAEHIGEWMAAPPVRVKVKEAQVLGALIEPAEPHRSDTLEATVKLKGAEPEEVELFFRWLVNGEMVEGAEGPTLDGESFAPGDQVVAEVSTDSEFEPARTRRSPAVTIKNTPPVIQSELAFSRDGEEFTYQVEAEDEDGDALTYTLEKAAPGMTIDGESGLVTWKPSSGQAAVFSIKIVVSDGHGGKAAQAGQVSLRGME